MKGKSNYFRIPRCIWMLVFLLLAGGFFNSTALAEAESGFGMMAGVTDTSIKPELGNKIDASGPSFGIDYQIPLGEMFSVNPFYILSRENGSSLDTDGTIDTVDLDTAALGVQLRLWIGEFYAGVHAAQYDVDISSNGVKVLRQDDTGFGLAVGYENPNGFSIFLRTEAVTVELPADPIGGFPAEDLDIESFRLYLAYRF